MVDITRILKPSERATAARRPDGTEDEELDDAPQQRLAPRKSLTEPPLDDRYVVVQSSA